ncbi:MAG: glycerophosphodiester phosphodiesterase [Candidatus Binatia bacterium]
MGYFSGPKPRKFGHRGAAGLAPENTMPSFRQALADGADILELDVHATRDGAIVVIHDDTVDRTTDGRGEVRGLELAALQRLDAGYHFEANGRHPFRGCGVRIPTLREVMLALPEVALNVEVKQLDPPIEREVRALLDELGRVDDVVLAAEHDEVMKRLHAAAPGSWFSFSSVEAMEIWQRLQANDFAGYRPPGHALQIPPRFGSVEVVTAESVAAVHALGVELHVWTINDEPEMERLLDLGVDGVMSDYPGKLRDVVRRRAASS